MHPGKYVFKSSERCDTVKHLLEFAFVCDVHAGMRVGVLA